MIRNRGIARRYAVALFGAAEKAGVAEPVLADLYSLEELERRDPALQRFLEAPDVLTEHKTAVVATLLKGRVHPLVSQLFAIMLQKKRIQHLPPLYEEYRDLVEASRGISRARVTTAMPLDAVQEKDLVERLQKLTGKTVRLETRIDPSVIGGVATVIGGKILDGTLRHRLGELREQLLSTRVHGTPPVRGDAVAGT